MNDIAHYLESWKLSLEGEPFETPSSWLAYTKRRGARTVLKIPKPHSDEHDGAKILLQWDAPAVRVVEHDDHALLVERVLPGIPLADLFLAGKDEEAAHIWCDAVEALHVKPAPKDWLTVTERGHSFNRDVRHELLQPDVVEKAREDYFALCASQSSRWFLLHADLNHFNILKDDTRGWIVIDPKGFVGELEFETGTLLRNPIPNWETFARADVLNRRVRILCDRLNLDSTRILRWCAAQAVLSAIWSAEGHGDTAKLQGALRVAEAANSLLTA